MKLDYLDALNAIYKEIGDGTFIVSDIRPILKPQFELTGGMMKTLVHAGMVEEIPGGDVRKRKSHYVHTYRILPRGEQTVIRRFSVAPAAAAC